MSERTLKYVWFGRGVCFSGVLSAIANREPVWLLVWFVWLAGSLLMNEYAQRSHP